MSTSIAIAFVTVGIAWLSVIVWLIVTREGP